VIVDYALLNGYTEVPYFLFGTTNAGRDLFSLIWVATRTSLLIGFLAAAINITIGVVYGAVSGYYGGNVDLIMERFSEIVGRIPFLVVLAIFISVLGAGIQTLIFILVISGWIGVSNVTRTQFYRFKGREYVLASRTLGAKDLRLIFRHILPNGIGTIITASVLLIPATIFTESTISFLGFGIGHGSSFSFLGFEFSGVSVGVLLSDGRQELLTRPYLTVFPAIIISILMITFNMFGNALRDALNPSLRGSL
jgi:ABC-type dipeptide/oligopeptide/nickel transport system permease subunit